MIAAVIANVSGKTLKHSISERVFMPNYLGDVSVTTTEKSVQQQHAEFRAFTARYRAAVKEARSHVA